MIKQLSVKKKRFDEKLTTRSILEKLRDLNQGEGQSVAALKENIYYWVTRYFEVDEGAKNSTSEVQNYHREFYSATTKKETHD